MQQNQTDTKIILSFYPNSYGLGYTSLELPKKLLEAGIVRVRPFSNDRFLERVERFAEFHKPTVIVIRDTGTVANRRCKRIEDLLESITQHAEKIKVPVYRYSRQQVRDVFELWGARTKEEIAKQIIVWFPQLADRVPRIREPWMNEDYNMGIFDAAALAITHEYLTE